MGSYYSQSDVCRAIQEKKEKRIAAVLLGCQSRSVSLAENLKNVQYKIGLICESQYSKLLMEDLAKTAKLPPSKIIFFRWRDKTKEGWPGSVRIKTKQRDVLLKSKFRVRLKSVYKNFACSLCQDKMNAYADIVCGDPWGIDCDDIKKGYTCIIARTEKGLELLRNAQKEGYINLYELDSNRITDGQKVDEKYYQEKNQIREYCKMKQWIYPDYLNSKECIENNKIPNRNVINQLRYEKELYDCSTYNKIKRLVMMKKVQQMLEDLKKLPDKILFKLNLIKVGKK